ncbi:MAG: DUF3078 domain-containing protein [Candidatus Zixiibacteriota bacterium]|nr:MAG: DUF3078 domain-containing protein [candidate division Zixibacteria bacterium]
MLKHIVAAFCLALLILPASSVLAEDDSLYVGWKKSLIFDFTTTQTAYSDSWVGGEVGSVNWVSNLNGSASKYLKEWLELRSSLRLSFGQTKTQDEETREWSDWKKSTDLIDFENVGLFDMHAYVDPYAAFRLESQVYDGRNPRKKLYLSPMKLTESAGVARKLYAKDDDLVISRLGLALRQIMRTAITDTISLATTRSTETDGGLESVTDASLTLHEDVKLTSKLSLYKAFFFSESDKVEGTEFEDYWKAIDVNWENIVNVSVTKILTVSLYTQLLYDKELSKRGRVKETVAIGVTFKLI